MIRRDETDDVIEYYRRILCKAAATDDIAEKQFLFSTDTLNPHKYSPR